MARIDELMAAALAAVPVSGEIEVPTLIQKLKTEGNGDAVPLLAELKKRNMIASKLEALEGGGVRHTYRRVAG